MKTSENFFQVWGGIAGAQHNFPLLLDEALRRKFDLSHSVRLTSTHPAQRLRLGRKGDLRVGWDADLVVLDPGVAYEIRSADLLTRHQLSPYVGRTCGVRVTATIAGGRVVHGPQAEPRSARILRPISPL
jgi:allantoinase